MSSLSFCSTSTAPAVTMSLLSSVGWVSVYFASSWLGNEPCAPAVNHGKIPATARMAICIRIGSLAFIEKFSLGVVSPAMFYGNSESRCLRFLLRTSLNRERPWLSPQTLRSGLAPHGIAMPVPHERQRYFVLVVALTARCHGLVRLHVGFGLVGIRLLRFELALYRCVRLHLAIGVRLRLRVRSRRQSVLALIVGQRLES